MNIFLRLKHWQLFLLQFGIPFTIQIITMASIVSSRSPVLVFELFPVIMILFAGALFGWIYAVATNLHKKLPDTVSMNLTRLKIFLFIPLFYIVVIGMLFFGFFKHLLDFGSPPSNPTLIISFALIIIPIHLFSMFCIFYCLWFTAKSLKSVELQKPVTFSDFVGEFFLIWYFPLGVWFLQPRINKLFEESQ